MIASAAARQPVGIQAEPKCRLCQCKLDVDAEDDFTLELCSSCKARPEARRLGMKVLPLPPRGSGAAPGSTGARDFTPAEKGLIRRVHGYMPAQQLLGLLNERLACDLGPDAKPYTMNQLYTEIGDVAGAVPAGGHDWASLRKLIAQAKRNGVLDAVNEQVINDFAVVFSLNAKQLLSLKDIILDRDEEQV